MHDYSGRWLLLKRSPMMSGLPLLLILLALWSASTGAANPGFKVTLTSNGLNYARQVGVQFIEQKFAKVTIPNQSGTDKAPVIGKIEWSLTNIVLSGLNLPQSAITILPGRGVQVSISQASLQITMDFSYKEKGWPHIGGKGNLVIRATGINIVLALAVGETNGRPTLEVISSTCGIGKLNIKEHGGPSWLINFFLGVLNAPIKKAAENGVGNAIRALIQSSGNNALQTIPFQEQFGGIAEIDYSLVSGPTFGANYLTLNSKAEFYYLANKTEAPFPVAGMPDEVNGQMMQILLTEFVPNSASYVFRQAGKMSYTLTDAQLPSWSPIRLTTDSWSHILPELSQKYPNMQMNAQLSTSSPPKASFSAQGIQVSGPGLIVVNIIPGSGAPIPVFALNINLVTTGKVSVSNGRIYGQLSYLNSPVTVAFSNVGNIDLGQLDSIITSLCTNAIVPFFNYYLSHGINIPTIKGVTLINPTIAYGAGYIAIASDINYAL